MTLKSNNNPNTARAILCFAPKKHDGSDPKWKQCCLFCFFGRCSIVHYKFAPEGQTVNQDFYLVVLRYLYDAVRRKWPDMWTARCWLVHHMCLLTALSIRWQNIQFLPFLTNPPPPFRLTSLFSTFFYSLNSKLLLMEEVFRWWKTSLMWRMIWRQYHILWTVLQKIEKVVGKVHCCTERLFWRE
jgi:hypothetical protein